MISPKTIPATPLTVYLERLEQLDELGITVWRGNVRLGATEIERGDGLHDGVFELSRDELSQINGLVIAEWLHWPATGVRRG